MNNVITRPFHLKCVRHVLSSAESLTRVADAWVDFLAISRAAAAVVSSSAFSLMAAEAAVHGSFRLFS